MWWYGHCVKMTYIVNPDPEEDSDPSQKDSRCSVCIKKTKAFFKPVYKVGSSHVGLILILLTYTFIGGGIFSAIEGPYEEKEKHEIIEMRENIISSLWNESIVQHIWNTTVIKNETGHILEDKELFVELVRGELNQYEEKLRAAFAHGIKSNSSETVWDFWGATLYSGTVYTTIGYGHIAPATIAGRIFTMLYAIMGVPLCLVVLADLGVLFTRALKYIWAFIRRFYFTGSFRKIRRLKRQQFKTIRRKLSAVGAGSESDLDSLSRWSIKSSRAGNPKAFEAMQSVDTEVSEFEAYDVDGEFNLPPFVAIMITVTYILLGAAMYTGWENWTFLEAFYFVFISISTIGFGDIVPLHTKFFLASAIYILIGLSLVAMVVNVFMVVVKDTVSKAQTKLHDVSQRLGIHLSIDDILETSSMKSEDLDKDKKDTNEKETDELTIDLDLEETLNNYNKPKMDTLQVPVIEM